MRHNPRLHWQNEERKLREQAAAARDRKRKSVGTTEAVQVKRSRYTEIVGKVMNNTQEEVWWEISCPRGCHFGEVFKVWGPQANYDCAICKEPMRIRMSSDT